MVFVAIFAGYAWRLSKAPVEVPDLRGVSAFAENLVDTGSALGVDEFLLGEPLIESW